MRAYSLCNQPQGDRFFETTTAASRSVDNSAHDRWCKLPKGGLVSKFIKVVIVGR